jgi:hypothetical protein
LKLRCSNSPCQQRQKGIRFSPIARPTIPVLPFDDPQLTERRRLPSHSSSSSQPLEGDPRGVDRGQPALKNAAWQPGSSSAQQTAHQGGIALARPFLLTMGSSAQHHHTFRTAGNGSDYIFYSNYQTTSPFHAGAIPGHYTSPVGGGFAAMLWLQQKETYVFLLLQIMAVVFACVASLRDGSTQRNQESSKQESGESVRTTDTIPEGRTVRFA